MEYLDDILDESLKKELAGYRVVLYFYPKDNTKGCTLEAQEFSALTDDFLKIHTKVVGISKSTEGTHKNFIKKYDLKFPLIADPTRKIHKKYDVLLPAKMYGKDVIKTIRSTFIYDENHQLIKQMRDVKPEGHALDVLEWMKEL